MFPAFASLQTGFPLRSNMFQILPNMSTSLTTTPLIYEANIVQIMKDGKIYKNTIK